jgi:hypothetical protein
MTFRALVERYLGAVAEQYQRGDATESSYYGILKQLWEDLGPQAIKRLFRSSVPQFVLDLEAERTDSARGQL